MGSYLKQLLCFRPQTSMSPHQVNTQPPGFNGMLMICFGFRFMAPFGVIAIIVTTWMDHGLIAIRLESLKPPCGKVFLVKCNNQPFAKHGTSWEIESLIIKNHGKLKTLDHRNPWIKNHQKPICLPHVLFQTVFVACLCWSSFIIAKHQMSCRRNPPYIYMDNIHILHNTSHEYVTTHCGSTHLIPLKETNSQRICPRDSSWWLVKPPMINKKYALSQQGFILKPQVLACFENSAPWQILFYQSGILLIKVCCVFFPGVPRFMSLIQASTFHTASPAKTHPSWRDRSLPTNLWQPDQ